MNHLKAFSTAVLLLTTIVSYAQQEVIIIDRGDKQERIHKEKEVKLNDNVRIVKFAPLNLMAGEICFGYEQKISQKSSLDFELGPTISKIGFTTVSHIGNDFQPSIGSLSALGFVGAIGLRYYPLDETEALNRFYVSPVFRFKLFNHKVKDFSNILTSVQKGQESRTNFLFNFGYQIWPAKTFSIDFYAGVGIGFHTERDYHTAYSYVNNQEVYEWVEDYSSGAQYVVNTGLKLGIGSK